MSKDPYQNAYDIARSCIRYMEGSGKLFHPNAAKRAADKCASFFYSPSCVDKMEAALNAEIIWSREVDRIEECCGGYKVLVGWQEWMLFRELMI